MIMQTGTIDVRKLLVGLINIPLLAMIVNLLGVMLTARGFPLVRLLHGGTHHLVAWQTQRTGRPQTK